MGFFSRKTEKRIAAYQSELIETHYREVENMYRQMRGWRHDYRSHIQTMKAYAAAGDWEAIKRYLDLLDQDLSAYEYFQTLPPAVQTALRREDGGIGTLDELQARVAHLQDSHLIG